MADLQDDLEHRTSLDLIFHTEISRISGNQMLQIFVQSMNRLLEPMVRASLSVPMTNEDGVHYHDRIIAALQSCNADQAEAIMREHLALFMRNYEEAIQEGGRK